MAMMTSGLVLLISNTILSDDWLTVVICFFVAAAKHKDGLEVAKLIDLFRHLDGQFSCRFEYNCLNALVLELSIVRHHVL